MPKLLTNTSYNSPRWSYEVLDCSMPMTFDTYSNCSFQCIYCFSFFQRAIGLSADNYLSHTVKSVNVDKIKRMFTEPDKYAGQFAWYIKKRYVMQWGGLSDGFDLYEKDLRVSLDLLRFFREINYPISISTKSTWFLDDPEYVKCFRNAKNVHVKVSIITTDEEKAKVLEMGVSPPRKRFEVLRRLKDLGVGGTTTRFRPYIIGLSDKCVDEVFEKSRKAGVDSLTTEFLCLESRSSVVAKDRFRLLGELCGFNIFDFYRRHSPKAGLMRLNYEVKRPHFEHMLELAKKTGVSFFTSDAHHREKSCGTGCCGMPQLGPLSNIVRGHFAEAMQIAKVNKKVYWSDISSRASELKAIAYGGRANTSGDQAHASGPIGFNMGNTRNRAERMYHTMYDYVHEMWNKVSSHASPARYFGGVLVPYGKDAAGDVIYYYNQPLVDNGDRVLSGAELKARLFVNS